MTDAWPVLQLPPPDRLAVAGRERVSAASGLVEAGGHLVVAIDDAAYLGVFVRGDPQPGRVVPLLPESTHTVQPIRKGKKPDFEAVVELPGAPIFDQPSLLVMGSGSTERRMRAVRVPMSLVHGQPTSEGCALHDLDPLYAPMRVAAGDLNVEAVRLTQTQMVLVSRANREVPVNLVATFELSDIRDWMDGRAVSPPHLMSIDLGCLEGVPLGITDSTPHPSGGWLASAAAEDTADSYLDGRTVGSVVAWFGDDNVCRRAWRLLPAIKAEGISARAAGAGVQVTLVTDADDPEVAAEMYTVMLPAF